MKHNRENSSWDRKSLDDIIDCIDDDAIRNAFKRLKNGTVSEVDSLEGRAASDMEKLRSQVRYLKQEIEVLKKK